MQWTVGIHDNVGVVGGPDEKLHEEDCQLVLHQVEERDGVVNAVHEEHVVLVGHLFSRVGHEFSTRQWTTWA